MLLQCLDIWEIGKNGEKGKIFTVYSKKGERKIYLMFLDILYPAIYSLLGHSDLRNQAWNRPSKVQIAPQRSGLGR